MKTLVLLLFLSFACTNAMAWGRHDVITAIALDTPELSRLKEVVVEPEPIEKVAPDLLGKVIPGVQKWEEAYHAEHDTRYPYSVPTPITGQSDREALLWALDDNTNAPLQIGAEKTAAEILENYVNEPDEDSAIGIDGDLNNPKYEGRFKEQVSYWGKDAKGSRHFYVPDSFLPPILEPRGTAPERAGLYAVLASGAFQAGHPYWGYRFLAWSLHYIQDVTQPWHTVFLPEFSPYFLSSDTAAMKHKVSTLHFMTECTVDSWMLRTPSETALAGWKKNSLEINAFIDEQKNNRWIVSVLAEHLAEASHKQIVAVTELNKTLYTPVVEGLDNDMKPKSATISMGGIEFATQGLSFSDNERGATAFLAPIWNKEYRQANERDQLVEILKKQIGDAVSGTIFVVNYASNQDAKGVSKNVSQQNP